MKIKSIHVQYIGFFAMYLFVLFMWSQPYQDRVSPYGEWDAISHYGVANYMVGTEHSFSTLPPWMDYRYGRDNKFAPHNLWYPPPFHTNMASVASFSNQSVLPIFLTNTVFATAILLSVFFVVRRLYGFAPAMVSSLLIAFSLRDVFPYIWGQWPERFGYAFFPIMLYCYYRYHQTAIDGKPNLVYLYLLSFIGIVTFYIHPLSFSHTLVGLAVLAPLLALKDKKLPLPKLKHLGCCAFIFIVLLGVFPLQSANAFTHYTKAADGAAESASDVNVFERLFMWSLNPENYAGSVPASYFSFAEMHGSWTLPFLLIGIVILLLRRKQPDVFLLAWLIALYIILHRDIFGVETFLHRSLSATAHIFVPLTVLGGYLLARMLPIKKKLKRMASIGAVVLVALLAFNFNYPQADEFLKGAYASPVQRMNDQQLLAADWIIDNVPQGVNVTVLGSHSQTLRNTVWMSYYSNHVTSFGDIYKDELDDWVKGEMEAGYVMMDYSEISLIPQLQQFRGYVENFEQTVLANRSVVYQTDQVRIYAAP